MDQLTWTFVGVAALFIVLGIPMVKRRVPPNPWYGFRVPKTLAPGNEPIWYDANAYSGRWMVGAGIVLAAAALGFRLVPFRNDDSYAWAILIVLMTAMVAMLIDTFRYLKTL